MDRATDKAEPFMRMTSDGPKPIGPDNWRERDLDPFCQYGGRINYINDTNPEQSPKFYRQLRVAREVHTTPPTDWSTETNQYVDKYVRGYNSANLR